MRRFLNIGGPSGQPSERPRRSSRPLVRAAAVAGLLALMGSFPAQVSAHHLDSGMTISIGGPIRLVSGVYLVVPVQVTCPTLTAPLSEIFSDGIDVNVIEKTGKTFATGSGGVGYQSPAANGVTFGTPVICDGTAHAATVNVFPNPGSGPFHGGRAVASGGFSLGVFDPSSCVFCTLDDNFVRFGPESIKIH